MSARRPGPCSCGSGAQRLRLRLVLSVSVQVGSRGGTNSVTLFFFLLLLVLNQITPKVSGPPTSSPKDRPWSGKTPRWVFVAPVVVPEGDPPSPLPSNTETSEVDADCFLPASMYTHTFMDERIHLCICVMFPDGSLKGNSCLH